jgi:type IV pilus assembly protein PilE
MRKRTWLRGFTLLEMSCVLLLVSILAGVALPFYRHEFLVLGRTQGVTALMEVRQRQQGFFAQHRRYAEALAALGYAHSPFAIDRLGKVRQPDSAARIYLISLVTQGGNYTVTAQPQLFQGKDSGCGELSLSARGEIGVTGSDSVRQCWR